MDLDLLHEMQLEGFIIAILLIDMTHFLHGCSELEDTALDRPIFLGLVLLNFY